jgi:hypothetical protein
MSFSSAKSELNGGNQQHGLFTARLSFRAGGYTAPRIGANHCPASTGSESARLGLSGRWPSAPSRAPCERQLAVPQRCPRNTRLRPQLASLPIPMRLLMPIFATLRVGAARADPYLEANHTGHTCRWHFDPTWGCSNPVVACHARSVIRLDLTARAISSQSSDLPHSDVFLTLQPGCRTPGYYSYTSKPHLPRGKPRR